MGYSREVYDAAMAVLARRKALAEQEAEARKSAFYQMEPRAAEIQRELAQVGSAAGKCVVRGGDVAAALEQLREKSKRLQQERDNLLRRAGLEPDGLEPRYTCRKCGDTGSVDGRMCSCLKGLLRQESYRRLNESSPLTLSGFEQFSLRYYPEQSDGNGPSPREHMAGVLDKCRQYARQFSSRSPSLLFQGRTGLGKTHLSLAIAREVIDRGFGVLYGSTQNFMATLEKERFGRSDEDTNQALLQCDLLILDDLGTEFSTPFVTAALYNIINTRLMSDKPTIISTNLSMKELLARYGERMVSRMIGGYCRVVFTGRDVRQIITMEREKNGGISG